MFPHLTREDRLAIFQKFSPVSFSRFIRTCKWANQFVEANKRKIKIHTDKSLSFGLPEDSLGWPLATCVERVIKVQTGSVVDRKDLMEIPCKSREYEAILAEPRFRCFVFAEVENEEYAETIFWPFAIPPDHAYTFEVVAKVPARSLRVWYPSGPLPTSSYNYDKIDILNLKSSMLHSAFDLAEKNRNVELSFSGNPKPHLISRYCELLEKIVEQKIVTERICIFGGFSDEMLTFFLEAKKSETMVLAEGFEISLIPVTEKTFLAVYWDLNNGAFNEAKLIGSRETLYEHVAIQKVEMAWRRTDR